MDDDRRKHREKTEDELHASIDYFVSGTYELTKAHMRAWHEIKALRRDKIALAETKAEMLAALKAVADMKGWTREHYPISATGIQVMAAIERAEGGAP